MTPSGHSEPNMVALPDRVVRRITEDVVDQAHEWFYEQLGGDADELYEEIADGQGLDLEIESALKLVKVRSAHSEQ